MTREEEIIETAKFIYSPSSGIPQSLPMRVGFIEGAKWADSHPKDVYTDLNGDTISFEEIERRYKQGVDYRKRKMIDKACDWLDKVNTDNYMDSGIFQMSELISDFRKAMEE